MTLTTIFILTAIIAVGFFAFLETHINTLTSNLKEEQEFSGKLKAQLLELKQKHTHQIAASKEKEEALKKEIEYFRGKFLELKSQVEQQAKAIQVFKDGIAQK